MRIDRLSVRFGTRTVLDDLSLTIERGELVTETSTAEQIRTFLKQARQALNIGDFYGAQTLATTAKLLLDELNK